MKLTLIVSILLLSSNLNAGDKTNIIIGQSLDLISTEYALSRGAYEANPLLRSQDVRITYKLISTTTAIIVCKELRKRNPQSKTAKYFSRGVLIVFGGIAVNNYIQGRRNGTNR